MKICAELKAANLSIDTKLLVTVIANSVEIDALDKVFMKV